MLEELDIRAARFDFDAEKLKEVAKDRAVSERFKLDLSFMQGGGLSAVCCIIHDESFCGDDSSTHPSEF